LPRTTPFVAVGHELRRRGLAAPAIYAFDLDQGFLLIEDLGDRVFGAELARGTKIDALYAPAVDVLLAIVNEPTAPLLPIEGHAPYRLPPYDADAMLTEALLLVDWFWPALNGRSTPEEVRNAYVDLWQPLLTQAVVADNTLILRDYHSPNLMWLPERRPPASQHPRLSGRAEGARSTILCLFAMPGRRPEALEARQFARYCAARSASDPQFSSDQFNVLYATLGAQRNSKILGIFARLAKRDGKRGYLAHIPRVARYLKRNLAHPTLAPLRDWYQRELPPLDRLPSLSI
jgi:aminoglycoside/choline kinase family phosphotransferase